MQQSGQSLKPRFHTCPLKGFPPILLSLKDVGRLCKGAGRIVEDRTKNGGLTLGKTRNEYGC